LGVTLKERAFMPSEKERLSFHLVIGLLGRVSEKRRIPSRKSDEERSKPTIRGKEGESTKKWGSTAELEKDLLAEKEDQCKK